MTLLLSVALVLTLLGFGLHQVIERTQGVHYSFDANAEAFNSCLGATSVFDRDAGVSSTGDPEVGFDSGDARASSYSCTVRVFGADGRDAGAVHFSVRIYKNGDATSPGEDRLRTLEEDAGVQVLASAIPGYEFGFCYKYAESGYGKSARMCQARDANLELTVDADPVVRDVTAIAADLLPYLEEAFAR
ncbi:hypothetical protein [Glycomyces sp. NRRL B-16210]|uniref:hypothetical protein n=1 Tax=Glycomyces sp. NRRL B-16210 TaxID=1463821 RepID=UPI0004C1839A|nr:hypothetical protein [Glycomyces sp. NRRL B-16210]